MIEASVIGFATAFGAGALSFLSPCVLPLIPGYVGYVTGRGAAMPTSAAGRLAGLGLGGAFVLGFATVFMALGAGATAIGRLLLSYKYEANLVAGVIVGIFGLALLDIARLPWLDRDLRFRPAISGGRPLAAYLLGLAFGFGWTPCIGPVLGAVLTMAAVKTTLLQGIILLAFYAAGLGLPLLSVAFGSNALVRGEALRRAGRPCQVVGGVVMILMGVAMITDRLSTFSYWLLETFPMLGSVG